MAASALVAWSDGTIAPRELSIKDFCLENLSKLNIFEPHEASDIFLRYVRSLQDNPTSGKAEVLEAIDKLPDNKRDSDLLISICIGVGNCDCDLSQEEVDAIVEVGQQLGASTGDILAKLEQVKPKLDATLDPLTGLPRD
ncbi:tellurite resistance TerB family protein [Synechococcus sp. PCC 7336]|uniref:tellurite resistance TerB family protein n=1 Tax=Synechococcus sp. PCC 7336 TaxID=195250 RepID=UPI00138AB04D|nr:TerB family tellurite resistance protein [Synechococcus sp. PCC 7336]